MLQVVALDVEHLHVRLRHLVIVPLLRQAQLHLVRFFHQAVVAERAHHQCHQEHAKHGRVDLVPDGDGAVEQGAHVLDVDAQHDEHEDKARGQQQHRKAGEFDVLFKVAAPRRPQKEQRVHGGIGDEVR